MTIKFENIVIEGSKIGLRARGPVEIDSNKATFSNVETPMDLGSQATGSIKNSRVLNDPKMGQAARSVSGWRRPEGPPLPVFCPQCKSIFASRNYVFAGQFWQLWGNEEPCIECGYESAQLSNGTFNLARDIAEIITAPDITYAMLRAIQEVAQEAHAGIITTDDAITKVAALNPSAGKWLKGGLIALGLGAFTLLNNAAGIGSFLLSIEQTQMQRASKTDQILEQILEKLPESDTKALRTEESAERKGQSKHGSIPAEEQAPKETGSFEPKKAHGLKSSRMRNHNRKRQERADRRSALRGDSYRKP